jgi:hypothetical protein
MGLMALADSLFLVEQAADGIFPHVAETAELEKFR